MPLAPASIGIIFNEPRTHLVLVKRQDVPVWTLPGGGIDPGESPSEAVIREVFEETGLTVEIERQCAEYYPVNRLAALTAVFICRIKEGSLTLSNETQAIQFYPVDSLPSTLFNPHREWIQDAIHSSQLIKKPLTQITYFAVFKYFLQHPVHILSYAWTRWIKNR